MPKASEVYEAIEQCWKRSSRRVMPADIQRIKAVRENGRIAVQYAEDMFDVVQTCYEWEGYRLEPRSTHPEPTLKPPGRSLELSTQLDNFNEQIKVLEAQARVLRQQRTEASVEALLELFPDKDPNGFEFGHWFCDGSPTGSCVYNDDGECCIICGNPEERK